MTRAKLAIIVGSAVVIIGGGVGVVWWLRSRPVPAVTGRPETGPGAELAAPPVAGSLKTENVALTGAPAPSQVQEEEQVSVEDLKKILVYSSESQGLPGEEPPQTMADILLRPTTAPAEEAAPVLVIPEAPAAGTGGGPAAVPSVEGSADPDNDGLTNDQELQQGTDPNKADTDRDGLTDGDEVRKYRTDPLKTDTDGDGLADGGEVSKWQTDPLNPDTDGDGFPDGTEAKGGYNPRGPGKL